MKSKRIISIVLSLSITIGSILGASYAAKAADPLHGVVSSKQGLNVRSESNSNAKIIGSLKLDESVEILETTGDWCKIKFGSSYGYVSKQYVVLDKNTPNKDTPDKNTSNNNTPPKEDQTKENQNPSTGDKTPSKVPEYKNFDQRKNIDTLKQWKIKFNRKIKDTESNKNEFKVIDSKGNFISTKILIEDYSVTVIPWSTSYNYEETYKLIIGDNIESADGIKIKYTSTLPFSVKSKVNSLGLGEKETESVNNDRNYDWYIGQNDTGKYLNVNSGPAAVAMAIKWTTPLLDKSIADIRDAYENSGSAWSISNIVSCLKDSNINYSSCDTISEDSLKKQLKDGNILIANLNPQYINYNNSSESKVGRFHAVDGNTYTVIIKGYRVVDGKNYFEIYDPFNINSNYSDGSPKGKNNYYPANEILNSLTAENVHPIVISKSN